MPPKRRAIKNYTTEILPSKTAGEISDFLAERGARAIQIEYGAGGTPESLAFAIEVSDQRFYYKLPAKAEGVLATLKRDRVEPRYQTLTHARAVAWRIVYNWVEAQLALVDAGAADIGEVFLPYLMIAPGETVYQRFLSGRLALTEAK